MDQSACDDGTSLTGRPSAAPLQAPAGGLTRPPGSNSLPPYPQMELTLTPNQMLPSPVQPPRPVRVTLADFTAVFSAPAAALPALEHALTARQPLYAPAGRGGERGGTRGVPEAVPGRADAGSGGDLHAPTVTVYPPFRGRHH